MLRAETENRFSAARISTSLGAHGRVATTNLNQRITRSEPLNLSPASATFFLSQLAIVRWFFVL